MAVTLQTTTKPVVTLTTQRPTLSVVLDGVSKELPITFNAEEFKQLTKYVDANGDTDASGFVDFFVDFAAKYLGDAIKECGSDQLLVLMNTWSELYKEETGVSVGEQVPSLA